MHPDVAERGRAQYRVGDRVRQHVSVGVPLETEFALNPDASEDQRTSRSDAVDIPPLPDPDRAHSGAPWVVVRRAISSRRKRCARSMSVGLVILMLRSLPGTTLTSTSSRSTMLLSSVAEKPSLRASSNARFRRS